MRFDIYGRFVLVVERVSVTTSVHPQDGSGGFRFRVLQVGADGKRRERDDIVIPDTMPQEQIAQYLDDVLHEYAHPGARVRLVDPV